MATLFFAAMNACIKYLKEIPVVEIILFRAGITLIMSYAAIVQNKLNPLGVQRKWLVARGLAGLAGLSLYFVTVQKIPLASAVTIQYTSPLFTVFLAYFILNENPGKMRIVSFIVAFAGVLLIRGFDSRVDTLMLLAGIGSAFFSGLAYNFIRLVKDTDHPHVVVFYFPLVTFPIVVVPAIIQWKTPNFQELILLICVGVFTQIAQVQMTKAFQKEQMAKVSIVQYLGVLYALLIGFFLFDETFSWQSLLGMALVISGVLFSIVLGWQNMKKQHAAN